MNGVPKRIRTSDLWIRRLNSGADGWLRRILDQALVNPRPL